MASSTESDPLPSQETTLDPSSVTQQCEPESSHRECPICYHRLPIDKSEHGYLSCCGQVICHGCMLGEQRTQLKELGIIIEDTTPEEEQFRLIKEHGMEIYICPYCRALFPEDDEELLQRLYDRIEIRIDRDYTIALIQLGSYYKEGERGLPQNLKKAEELYKEAYDLDNPVAAWNLSCLYRDHYSDQKETEMEYLLRGEMLGNIKCIQVLAKCAHDSGNMEEFTRLWMKVVCLGGDTSILLDCYRVNLLSKDDLATTLRANQAVKNEIETKRRDFASRYAQFLHDAS